MRKVLVQSTMYTCTNELLFVPFLSGVFGLISFSLNYYCYYLISEALLENDIQLDHPMSKILCNQNHKQTRTSKQEKQTNKPTNKQTKKTRKKRKKKNSSQSNFIYFDILFPCVGVGVRVRVLVRACAGVLFPFYLVTLSPRLLCFLCLLLLLLLPL